MKSAIYVAMTLSLILFTTHAMASRSIKGSEVLTMITQPLQGIHQVSVSTSGELYITQGTEESLKIEAEDNIIPLIQILTDGQRLTVQFIEGVSIRRSKPIKLYLTIKDLNELHSSGSLRVDCKDLKVPRFTLNCSGSATINMGITTQELHVTISGSGNCTFSGKADKQSIVLSGSGRIRALDLESGACAINITGSGSVDVMVKDTLTGSISGSGTVRYAGNPQQDVSISGSGSVKRAPSKGK